MIEKTKQSSGADERTPSIPQYFSWINSTNEGSTEHQTMINLDYFKWLHDYYGMKLKIYAWDAGNLDGASGTYEGFDSPKLKKQYPNGYKPSVDRAAEFDCQLGVWGGADGFGNTPEEEKARYDLMVGLCKDLNFMEFKFDTVCGALRPEKRDTFHKMINECRQYSPDLIVLNHRNDLGEAEICATTFLWSGEETYIDILIRNSITGPHHRVCTLARGLVPDMKRLTEDHGVCISSCIDYFEDDLILQAFSRCLILAPETYGNPWLMRDDEQARYARIYNIHAKYADILVDGITLPQSYGEYAVARGDGKTRLITLRNLTWQPKTISIKLDAEIGLSECDKVSVKTYHPYESFIGTYNYGDTINVDVIPFRAMLIAVVEDETFKVNEYALTNCEYEVIREINGQPYEVKILKTNGNDVCFNNKPLLQSPDIIDDTIHAPINLGYMETIDMPDNNIIEQLYEATMFNVDNDSFEAQSLKRSRETNIPQVENARNAFFNQATYIARGCESRLMFDGCADTYFDANTRYYGTRIENGCLRVDFKEVLNVKYLEIEFFMIQKPIHEVLACKIPTVGSYSTDLLNWNSVSLSEVHDVGSPPDWNTPVVKHSVHNIEFHLGRKMKATYKICGDIRYFRLPESMDRIYTIRLLDANGEQINLNSPSANNMMAAYNKIKFNTVKSATVTLPDNFRSGSYISVAIEGVHGVEGAYCAGECDGVPIGFHDRAASYPINNWEHIAARSDKCYTYYLKLDDCMRGKDITLYTMFKDKSDIPCDIYLCDPNDEKQGIVLTI